MLSILAAFRAALVADATLGGLVPDANVYAGQRDEKTVIPAIDVFIASKVGDSKRSGKFFTNATLQVSIYERTDIAAQTIEDAVYGVLLADNAILNTAQIRGVRFDSGQNLPDGELVHIPLRFSFTYIYTV
ncbi:MAG: hypothetical protein KAJ03_09350 [Gammaproteobacteria bacterium]|nr:hypothetical protein [Gammaproteobacteria bacterium]